MNPPPAAAPPPPALALPITSKPVGTVLPTFSHSKSSSTTPVYAQTPFPVITGCAKLTPQHISSPTVGGGAAYKSCESCAAKHDGSYGSGRFCSSNCAKKVGASIKWSQSLPSASGKLGGGKGAPWGAGAGGKKRKKNEERKCENCGVGHDGSYGSGRFCSVHCARRVAASRKWEKQRGEKRKQAGLVKRRRMTPSPPPPSGAGAMDAAGGGLKRSISAPPGQLVPSMDLGMSRYVDYARLPPLGFPQNPPEHLQHPELNRPIPVTAAPRYWAVPSQYPIPPPHVGPVYQSSGSSPVYYLFSPQSSSPVPQSYSPPAHQLHSPHSHFVNSSSHFPLTQQPIYGQQGPPATAATTVSSPKYSIVFGEHAAHAQSMTHPDHHAPVNHPNGPGCPANPDGWMPVRSAERPHGHAGQAARTACSPRLTAEVARMQVQDGGYAGRGAEQGGRAPRGNKEPAQANRQIFRGDDARHHHHHHHPLLAGRSEIPASEAQVSPSGPTADQNYSRAGGSEPTESSSSNVRSEERLEERFASRDSSSAAKVLLSLKDNRLKPSVWI